MGAARGAYSRRTEEGYAAHAAPPTTSPRSRSRDPLARLFPGLARTACGSALDWILTIVGAVAIAVVLLKVFVVNPYRIPVVVDGACAELQADRACCLGDSSDRVLACRICLRFGQRAVTRRRSSSSTPLKKRPLPRRMAEGGTFVKRVIGLPNEIDPRGQARQHPGQESRLSGAS